ncbi:neutral/alkaline non-lysosomal ceramidase N-terminal domain-containing protein [Marinilongibacter aquaticus]|uniref:neutral/alkaline non-lysosomal ceramidase N-terminal domain-containing protein n=1 Tax=Marinilongibacter aquaticus TaxID=2975157 RepID=UPI0021BDC711|nr:neutral/alkaline non-lysosomal ceramidase N-terminal domain-containing protein [Marinilongibacter aquaticus]UBM59844.1 neutral/alkaline non-lysosomal ceramidase N-terminal domain-containing protein [Marinilongibacter aquaticus]
MLKKVGISLLVFLLLILVFLGSMLTTLDRRPYQDMAYYKEWKEEIEAWKPTANSAEPDSIYVGWAKENITPPEPVPLAGYGVRKGKAYTSVHDSVYVRSIVFRQGQKDVALVSADMLILPPTVRDLVKTQLPANLEIYYGAIHSHNSIGGWYNTLVGRLFAGKYDPEIEEMLTRKILKSIDEAKKDLQAATFSFEKDFDDEDIRNRLVQGDAVEPYIRSLVIHRTADKAILCTYAAHATVLDSKTMWLSRDYPGQLVDNLEKNGYAFASYMAGTVGSMGPIEKGENDEMQLDRQAQHVSEEVLSENEMQDSLSVAQLQAYQFLLPLRNPSPRMGTKLALRPWAFYWLFGRSNSYISVFKLGKILMIGMPCDFSGELMPALDKYAQERGYNLIVTSFNGGYTGYITADNRFDLDAYETTTMSWFGPYNGAYFSEAVRDIIDKLAYAETKSR